MQPWFGCCVQPSTMVAYGERLKQAMEAEQVTVQALADQLKVTYQAVKKVLDGKTKSFNAPNHEDACQILNVSGRWLAKGEGLMRMETGRGLLAAEELRPYSPAPKLQATDEWQVEGQKILASLSAQDRRAAVLQLRVFVAQLHTPGNGEGLPVAA
jgi:transcriptional regulator with XRE-family HTH domain